MLRLCASATIPELILGIAQCNPRMEFVHFLDELAFVFPSSFTLDPSPHTGYGVGASTGTMWILFSTDSTPMTCRTASSARAASE
jgi:hypothetical protein